MLDGVAEQFSLKHSCMLVQSQKWAASSDLLIQEAVASTSNQLHISGVPKEPIFITSSS